MIRPANHVTSSLYACAASALDHGRPELAEAVERIADEHRLTRAGAA